MLAPRALSIPVIVFAVVSGVDTGFLAAKTPCLVPRPKQVHWAERAPLRLKTGTVAIVISAKASDPERYAAEILQAHVARRFQQQWPILSEDKAPETFGLTVLLGRRSSNQRLDRLCSRRNIDLNQSSPGHDGYMIDVLTLNQRHVVLVGGSDSRGVIYGQDTLLQMLRETDGEPVLVPATVRDWPTIRWRGRPQTDFRRYLRPGELDCYMESRINFIDLRDGIYAFEPGASLDEAEIARAIEQAHRRGLVVFGSVNCGVARQRYEDVLGTYKQFLALGADGLWMSFDDKGPGDAPEEIVARVLALGREHNLAGHRFAITPPKGSYQTIATDFNRKIMAIPGMATAIWLWSRVPSAQDLASARSIGLKRKLGWWHNWPRPTSGRPYMGILPLSVGWHAPSYEVLAVGGKCADAVMPWGGNAWGQHYIVPVVGWWAWNPQLHDWNAIRSRIYNIVFGPGQVAGAMAFDDALLQVRAHLRYPTKRSEWLPFCPPRLNSVDDRQRVLNLTDKMHDLLDRIEKTSFAETMLDAEQLQTRYLNVMTAELATSKAAARLAYPEYWWEPQQRKILAAVYDDDLGRANQLIAAVRDQLGHEAGLVGKAFAESDRAGTYANWWAQTAKRNARGWQALIARRQKELARRVDDYAYRVISPAKMLRRLNAPPLDWGTGRWEADNRLLATVLPAPQEMFWGDWIGGVYRRNNIEAAVFAAKRKTPASVGEFSELEVMVPVSGKRDRLAVLLLLSNVSKETIAGHSAHARWAGYRFVELCWEDRVLWEADLGLQREQGEWFMVRLPPIPEDIADLVMQLRVEDRKPSGRNYTLVFVGPIRLLELPDQLP